MLNLTRMRNPALFLAGSLLIATLSSTASGQKSRQQSKPNPPTANAVAAEPSAAAVPAPPVKGSATNAPNPTVTGRDAQPRYRLRVTKVAPITVNLKAKYAPVAEIAAELGRQLEVPVILSPLMQRQKVSLDFAGMPLEAALKMLAPQPFVDYEVSGDAGGVPKAVGIYLNALNEEPPLPTALVKGDSEAILVEGNTEEGTDAAAAVEQNKDVPLRVQLGKNQVSVRARKQPLTAVLYEIANQAGIPFEMKYESHDIVDVDFSYYTFEQAIRSLAPNIRLYTRVDLSSYETKPLRLVLVTPANAQPTTKL